MSEDGEDEIWDEADHKEEIDGAEDGSQTPSSTPGSNDSAASPDNVKGPEWIEELNHTPPGGRRGPDRAEVVEMCIALMEFFAKHHPAIMKYFGHQLCTFCFLGLGWRTKPFQLS